MEHSKQGNFKLVIVGRKLNCAEQSTIHFVKMFFDKNL